MVDELTASRPEELAGSASGGHRIRALNPASEAEVTQVATRMRQTLVEVLGAATGEAMYTMEWLQQRVRWHLDPATCSGQVYLAEAPDGHILGHTIVRIDQDEHEQPIGLFSTTYVEPESRKRAVATNLLARGEAWMLDHDMTVAFTYTSVTNLKLIRLYEKHGYHIVDTRSDMVRLAKMLV